MADRQQTPGKPRPPEENPETIQAGLAPETYNDEQDDDGDAQAQQIAEEARERTPATSSPLDSRKGAGDSGLMDDSTQDLVDHMRDMEQSGRIDMEAYRGEPNHDDNEDKYGKARKIDNLRSDGS